MKALIIIPFDGKYILSDTETPSSIPLNALVSIISADYSFNLTDAVKAWVARQKEAPVIPPPESP